MSLIPLGQQQLRLTIVEAGERIATAQWDDDPDTMITFSQSLFAMCDFTAFVGLRFTLDANVKEIDDGRILFDAPCRFVVRGLQAGAKP